MTEKTGILRRMIECGVVAVARSDDPSQLVLAAEALKEGGVDVFEVTMSVPGALQVIRDMSQRFASEIIVGAGAILDGETAQATILPGARFIVGPCLNPNVIAVTRRYDKVPLLGALSRTEALSAWEASADIVKVFPIRLGGPRSLRDVLGPLH